MGKANKRLSGKNLYTKQGDDKLLIQENGYLLVERADSRGWRGGGREKMESEKTIRFFLLKPGGRLTGNHCVATVYALYIFYQYVCICSIFHKNHCFVSACCTENRLVGWKGRNGESCWGQGQLLRQEGTDVGSRAGIWWRQKKLLSGTFNLCFSNRVQGLIPETVLEGVMEKMSERGFICLFTQSLDFYR